MDDYTIEFYVLFTLLHSLSLSLLEFTTAMQENLISRPHVVHLFLFVSTPPLCT